MFAEFYGWLDDWRRSGPFFAYLHVLDLHGPYRPIAPPWLLTISGYGPPSGS